MSAGISQNFNALDCANHTDGQDCEAIEGIEHQRLAGQSSASNLIQHCVECQKTEVKYGSFIIHSLKHLPATKRKHDKPQCEDLERGKGNV